MGKKINLPLLGAHMSISGGLHKAIEKSEAIDGTTMQIFTKNSKSWFGKKISKTDEELFKQTLKQSKLSKIMAHASYLINLASKNPTTERKSVASLKHELHRCEQLEIPYLVLHPGSHVGQGEEVGIKKIIKNLDKVLETANGKTKILLETMAGQGTNLGSTFEQLKEILKGCKYKKLLGVCLDTCHIFVAGYSLKNEIEYKKTFEKFIKIIGIRKLNAIHINDSKTDFFSKKDRHENIGKGKIPLKIFRLIMNDKRLEKIPKVLESPDPKLYEIEIKKLKSFYK